MPPDPDVVLREDGAAQEVFNGGESRDKAVAFGGRDPPHSNLGILMSGEDLSFVECDGLD